MYLLVLSRYSIPHCDYYPSTYYKHNNLIISLDNNNIIYSDFLYSCFNRYTMAMKEWLQWLPPPRSSLALLLAIAGFSGRLFASHFTYSPTLLVDACHSLCRLVGLITTLLSYKVFVFLIYKILFSFY